MAARAVRDRLYITPFIVLTTFGASPRASNGTLATAYAVTTVAMIFTAVSYGKLARLYPMAGSAYTYARHAIDPRVGFMVGWAVLLDYFFLPMVVWLIGLPTSPISSRGFPIGSSCWPSSC